MKLITKEIERTLPPLYSQESTPDPIVHVHYFNPYGIGDWWITEGTRDEDTGDFILYGLCDLGFPELGYVSLAELAAVRIGPFHLGIERDMHWQPRPLSEVGSREPLICSK